MTKHQDLVLRLQENESRAITRSVRDLPALRNNPIASQALQLADEHSFIDPELAEEAGEARRAIAHAALNDLPGQVNARLGKLRNIVSLDSSLQTIARGKQAGVTGMKLFGKITSAMHEALRRGNGVRFESSKWDWDVRLLNSSAEVVPTFALERLTTLRMSGMEVGDLMIATPLPHPKPVVQPWPGDSAYVQRRFDDPVLLVRLPLSPFMIEIARWE